MYRGRRYETQTVSDGKPIRFRLVTQSLVCKFLKVIYDIPNTPPIHRQRLRRQSGLVWLHLGAKLRQSLFHHMKGQYQC